LQLLDRALFVDEDAGLRDLQDGKTDPAVLDLVKEYSGCPLGVCTVCGRPAPLSLNPENVCAWGCPP
jgi:hypothetical protein